jgi:hypothetical protein
MAGSAARERSHTEFSISRYTLARVSIKVADDSVGLPFAAVFAFRFLAGFFMPHPRCPLRRGGNAKRSPSAFSDNHGFETRDCRRTSARRIHLLRPRRLAGLGFWSEPERRFQPSPGLLLCYHNKWRNQAMIT